jgi:hypothetical protein
MPSRLRGWSSAMTTSILTPYYIGLAAGSLNGGARLPTAGGVFVTLAGGSPGMESWAGRFGRVGSPAGGLPDEEEPWT